MYCKNCGTVLADDALFCAECGFRMGEEEQQAKEQKESGKENVPKRSGKKGNVPLSIVLSILIVLLGTCASVIFLLRHMVSEDVLDSAVKALNVSEARLNFLEETPTITELIRQNLDPEMQRYMTDEGMEKLLSEKFVRRFVSDKVSDYVEDILKNTGEGIIETKEIEKLLEQNRALIFEDTLFIIEEGESHQLVSRLEELLEQTDLSLYRDEDPGVFRLIRCFSSYGIAAALLTLAVLAAAGIFALQDRKSKALSYLGADLLLIGALDLAAGGMGDPLVSLLNRTVGLGRGFWRALLDPVWSRSLVQGGILAAAGVILCLLYIAIRAAHRKNTSIKKREEHKNVL